MLSSVTKHLLHCLLLATVILVFEYVSGGLQWGNQARRDIDPWVRYGVLGTIALYVMRILTFLSFPQVSQRQQIILIYFENIETLVFNWVIFKNCN